SAVISLQRFWDALELKQDIAAIGEGCRGVGPQRQSLIVTFQSLFETLQPAQEYAFVDQRRSIGGVNRERLVIARKRFIEAPAGFYGDATVDEYIGKIGPSD